MAVCWVRWGEISSTSSRCGWNLRIPSPFRVWKPGRRNLGGPCRDARRRTSMGMWTRKAGLLERAGMGCEAGDLPGAGPTQRKSRNPGRRSGWWPLKISGLQGHSLWSQARKPLDGGFSALNRAFEGLHGYGARGPSFQPSSLADFYTKILQSWRNCGDYAGYPAGYGSPTHRFRTCTPALSKSTSGP